MDMSEQVVQPASFRFPFTDNEDSDLNLSRGFCDLKGVKTPSRKTNGSGEDGVGESIDSPSDLSMGLSPIARNRESDLMDISCMSSIGEVEEVDVDNEEDQPDDDRDSLESQGLEINQLSPVSEHSASSPLSEGLESAMKQVGKQSSNFIDKIRNAAHKRKVAVTRSRDSLVAKEQEQLRSIAESQSRLTHIQDELQTMNGEAKKEINGHTNENSTLSLKHSHKNDRGKSSFGGVGVPKVEKRPKTTPMSPMLGARRKGGNALSRVPAKQTKQSEKQSKNDWKKSSTATTNKTNGLNSQDRKKDSIKPRKKSSRFKEEMKKIPVEPSTMFKARPVLSSASGRWNAGQIGIPKVSKRSVTVPISPCLGPKRQSRLPRKDEDVNNSDLKKAKLKSKSSRRNSASSISTHGKVTSPSLVRNSPLLGLDLINSTRKVKSSTTDIDEMDTGKTPKDGNVKAFVPRSTIRANVRKNYDMLRDKKREIRLQEEREKLQSEIKVIHRELKIMSKELT